jgi:type IV pilus assembly protein PilW
MKSQTTQKGFSLVELMVALMIGFVVILGVSGIFVGSRQNYSAQDESSKFQENIRLATELVSRTLKHAGHRAPSLGPSNGGSIVTPLSKENAIVLGISGVNGSSTNVGAQDSVTARFQGNGLVGQGGVPGGMITDCTGNAIGTTVIPPDEISPIVYNTFSVQMLNGRPWLMCTTGTTSSAGADAAGAPIPLIPDVEAIEVVYGLHLVGAVTTVDRYVPQGALIDSTRIASVRVYLLMSTEAELSPVVDNQTYTLAENTYGPFNDRKMRRVVEISAALRNWNP